RQQRDLVQAQEASWKAAVIQLYKDVATSFYTVVALEKELSDVREEIGLYDRRVKDLNQRVRIGRSRVSEVLTVQALQANLSAQAESLDGQIRAQRALFGFLTGLLCYYAVQATEKVPAESLELKGYLAAIEARPDVQA